jgi:hypothetical protein
MRKSVNEHVRERKKGNSLHFGNCLFIYSFLQNNRIIGEKPLQVLDFIGFVLFCSHRTFLHN